MAEHKRLVYAEEVKEIFDYEVVQGATDLFDAFDSAIENATTVDAVEVVRCKECKFYTESKNRCDHPCMDYDVECYDQWLEMNPDDFCSYGERRTNHAQTSQT